MSMFTVICENVLCHSKYFVVSQAVKKETNLKGYLNVILSFVKLASLWSVSKSIHPVFFLKVATNSTFPTCLLFPLFR